MYTQRHAPKFHRSSGNSSRMPLSNKYSFFRRFLGWVLIGFLSFSILSCLLLRWLPAPTSAFMLYRHYEDYSAGRTYKPIEYRWISAKRISPAAFAAVIAAEDQRFLNHFGFDFDAIGSALSNYLDGRNLRGASTLSQQVAKNLYLTPARSFLRKGFEAWFTLILETFWPKSRILEMYVNIAEFGEHIFGIEAASRHYFGISASQLNKNQAALLAATLPNPVLYKAKNPSQYLLRRQRWILNQMRHLNLPAIS